ncbi:hypothetical protein ACFQYP_18125 [Nonomuraea antimicrobica]
MRRSTCSQPYGSLKLIRCGGKLLFGVCGVLDLDWCDCTSLLNCRLKGRRDVAAPPEKDLFVGYLQSSEAIRVLFVCGELDNVGRLQQRRLFSHDLRRSQRFPR